MSCPPLRIHILRLLSRPPIHPHRLDALDVEPVQHAQVEGTLIAPLSPKVADRFWQCSDLLVRQVVQVSGDVHATRLAEGPAPDMVAERVIRQVLAALDGELLLRGVDPDESALVVSVAVCSRGREGLGTVYPLTDAAVALNDGFLVSAILQRAVHSDGGGHGSAMAAPVVRLAVLETGRVGLRVRVLGGDVLGIKRTAVEPAACSSETAHKTKDRRGTYVLTSRFHLSRS